jgi:AGZA family xanthine/uracil permease-like MFS transporter
MNISTFLDKFFKLKELNTNIKTELLAGFTTFATLAYIMIVIPNILSSVGMPQEATTSTIIYMAFIGCMLMGLLANRPFAIAPLLAEYVFLAYTIIPMFGEGEWQKAFGAVAISAVILFILTICNIRVWLVNSLPACMKYAFTAGLGLYLAFVGLKGAGIINVSNQLSIGNFYDINTLLAITGIIIIGILTVRGIKVSMLIGLIVVTCLSVCFGQSTIPENLISAPSSISPLFLKADILGVLNIQSLPIIFIILVLMFVDSMGSLIGVSAKANFLDENGNLPQIKRPMLADSIATMIASSMCAITTSVYLESTTGITAGGRSGLTSVVIGILFLSGLFFSPVFGMIPSSACNAVLVIIGVLMLGVIKKINFDDMSEGLSASITIFLMAFSSNIGVAVASGFILYPILKIVAGKRKELNIPVWILFIASCIFFALYKF